MAVNVLHVAINIFQTQYLVYFQSRKEWNSL